MQFFILLSNESKISEPNNYNYLKEKLNSGKLRDVQGYIFSELFNGIHKQPHYKLSNSYTLNFTDHSTAVVDEERFMSPSYDVIALQTHLYTIIDGKFFSLFLTSPYGDPNHESLFKEIIKSLKFI
ncbi:MAG TPA: hypothetical protein VHJ38_09160, partial [Nitrososphaeraceae archaeon]|nr:hypothetical protein [Nitrososphaeraceae archaeon]